MSTVLEAPPVLIIRQSHLRALEEQCPAMARSLAVDHREGPSYTGAMRGTVIHTVFARYTEPEKDHRLLLAKLNLKLPPQRPPRITAKGDILTR